ncbi:MAG TPA: inorganic pyrophosphatase [Planctomycetota bacterium]|nr:inorganic pyrophosphatase [Planctomycetota bacterium]
MNKVSIFRSHPWHGVSIGAEAPTIVTCYVELVPTDTVKYEMDKLTGHLKVDRPQKYSNVCPAVYGLVPQTLCGDSVAALCAERTDRSGLVGDDDPLDICVLTEKDISHGDILLQAIPIGGLRLIDGQEADDKIVAVMLGDAVYGNWHDMHECPARVIERLKHYFLTYKDVPGSPMTECEITHVYGRSEAHEVILRSQADYHQRFG